MFDVRRSSVYFSIKLAAQQAAVRLTPNVPSFKGRAMMRLAFFPFNKPNLFIVFALDMRLMSIVDKIQSSLYHLITKGGSNEETMLIRYLSSPGMCASYYFNRPCGWSMPG